MKTDKKTIKVNFINFWPRFKPGQTLITQILEKHYHVEICDNPDYLFCSVIGKQFYDYLDYPGIRIMYSAENMIPDLNSVDYVISPYPVSLCDRCFHFPVGMRISKKNQYLETRSNGGIHFTKEDLTKKSIFANFCASHDSDDGKRGAFFKQLSESYKKVDSIGTFLNNTGTIVDMVDGTKWDYQRKCKFTLCFESVSQQGFNTEKIVDAFYTDTIPVYYGDPNIGQIYNAKAFINVRDYPTFDAAIARIKELDQDDEQYLEMLNQPVFKDPEYPTKFEADLEAFLLNIFEQPLEQAYRRARAFIPYERERVLRQAIRSYYSKPQVFLRRVKAKFRTLIHYRKWRI